MLNRWTDKAAYNWRTGLWEDVLVSGTFTISSPNVIQWPLTCQCKAASASFHSCLWHICPVMSIWKTPCAVSFLFDSEISLTRSNFLNHMVQSSRHRVTVNSLYTYYEVDQHTTSQWLLVQYLLKKPFVLTILSCYVLQYLHFSKTKPNLLTMVISLRKVHFFSENTPE